MKIKNFNVCNDNNMWTRNKAFSVGEMKAASDIVTNNKHL